MKNPLSIFSKVFRTAIDAIPLTEAVTLEFCYDHVNEDYPTFSSDESFLPSDEFQTLRTQEIE